MESKQLSYKNSASEEKDKSCQAPSKRRKRRLFPLKGCKSQIIDLPRHLRDVHKWSREKAQKATSKFGLRKSFSSNVVEKGKRKQVEGLSSPPQVPCFRLLLNCKAIISPLTTGTQGNTERIVRVQRSIEGSSVDKTLKIIITLQPW